MREGRRGRTLAQQEARAGITLLSPTLIVVLFMVVLPILWTIVIAFQSLRLRNLRTRLFDFQFTLDNFTTVLGSPGFLDALKVTVIYSVVGTVLSIGLGLIAALVVRKPFKGRTLVRASMLLPYVAPVVAVTFVWQIMLHPELGIVNAVGTDLLGWKEPIPFLEQRTGTLSVFGLDLGVPTALIVVILYQAWRYFPFSFLFILARLQALPAELDEAARVDGATPLQRFWRITLPQLQGVIALLTVLRFIWTFNEFDDIYLLTQGGAGTEVVSVRVFNYLTGRVAGPGPPADRAAVRLLPVLRRPGRGGGRDMSRTGVDTGVTERPKAPRAPARRPARPRPPLSREVVETRILGVLKWVTIAFFVIATLFPFYYMVELSIRSIEDVALDPGALWPPRGASLAAFGEVLRPVADGGQGFLVFLRNSGLVALASVVVTLAVSILGAYAIARLQFFGRRQVSFLFLAVYLFPAILLAIPLFVFFTRIGLRGSLFGLVLVYTSQIVPVTIYMLRNYFATIPEGLEEAAALDGAGRLTIIRKISLPLAMPAIMATSLFVFMIAWNEFLFALLFLVENRNNWTVSLGLSQLAGSVEVAKTTLMAGSVILTVPIIVLFFATERLLVEGLTSGAEKG
jgi:multiple sugar transport system permease protein